MKYGRVDVARHQEIKRRKGIDLQVFLNGEPVKGCVEADDIKGCVVVYKMDEAGKHVLETLPDGETAAARETRSGFVEFKPRQGAKQNG